MRLSLLLFLTASCLGAHEIGQEMSKGAENFLTSLEADQRTKANLPFTSEERFNWKYVPTERKGLSLKEMTPIQKLAALKFVCSALSSTGETKVSGIIQLETVLKELENGKGPVRDADLYYLTIFGKPSSQGVWSWRFEGHHLEIQVTLHDNQIIGITPHFMGANPGRVQTVKDNAHQPLEVLGNEDKLGRELASSLDSHQGSLGLLKGKTPSDILSGQSREAKVLTPLGISLADLSAQQEIVFWKIIESFVLRFKGDLVEPTLKVLRNSPKNKLTFAWSGGLKEGEAHYYRIQGPDFLLELDNTQNNANHVHTVWRDLKNDFGEDTLKRHLLTEHTHR